MDSNMENTKNQDKRSKPSLSGLFTSLVVMIVLITSVIIILVFIKIYKEAMEQNAIRSSEQPVVQVQNMVGVYTGDMEMVMDTICDSMKKEELERKEFIQRLVEMREDVVAVTMYNETGRLLDWWSNGQELKEEVYRNLSYVKPSDTYGKVEISKPHVESLFSSYYPWVVTISKDVKDASGNVLRIAMDIRFDKIANYVDDVGIGQRGYCYITDTDRNIIYHPRQQLLYSGVKQVERTGVENGAEIKTDAIYTAHTINNSNWRIVGVCYVDEMITAKVEGLVGLLIFILATVLISAMLVGMVISGLFSKPAKSLAGAMRDFEKNAENFTFKQVGGTEEIVALSDSFDHMVIRIQRLMDKVRKEEITLRKTELKALQAQINPHFLYNTLDAIAWLCEDGRNEDAEEMVNALAKLFRISISKGHELIPIEKEIQHAESYLKIENFRYKNQFTYTFDVDESCLAYLCNKITLQPIIENTIYHGLNRMVDEGEIRIGIHQDETGIVFTVEDNGVGMTEAQCEEILHKESGSRTGIGIKNVNDRIKIYFGKEYGLTISSELDEGTCVSIRMPKVTEGEYDGK